VSEESLELGDPHRDVEAFLDHVHAAVGEAEREAHFSDGARRIPGIRGARREVAERRRQRDAQHALWLHAPGSNRRIRFVDLGEEPRAGFVVARALVGEMQAARGAIDQPYAKACLQGSEIAAHERRRQTGAAAAAERLPAPTTRANTAIC
jgi:hypothetical protein